MKTKTIVYILCLTGFGLASFLACTYDEVFPPDLDPGQEISFSQEIVPIFDRSCNGAGCHNGSGAPPDLRPANAYDALWTGGYINIEIPEQSDLYLWMTEVKGPMPPLGANATDNAVVLQWITQGAKNN